MNEAKSKNKMKKTTSEKGDEITDQVAVEQNIVVFFFLKKRSLTSEGRRSL